MKLSELLEMLRKQAKSIDVSGCDFLAVQFNMKDIDKSDIDNPDQQKNPGVFYIEVKDNKISIDRKSVV